MNTMNTMNTNEYNKKIQKSVSYITLHSTLLHSTYYLPGGHTSTTQCLIPLCAEGV